MPDQIELTPCSLGGQLPGRVFRPGEDGYVTATAVWAKPVGPRPHAVVHCRTTDDIQLAIRAARDCRLPLVRGGGGHHWAGRALCAGIVMGEAENIAGVVDTFVRRRLCTNDEPDKYLAELTK